VETTRTDLERLTGWTLVAVSGDIVTTESPNSARLRLCFQEPNGTKLVDLTVEPDDADGELFLTFALRDRASLAFAAEYAVGTGYVVLTDSEPSVKHPAAVKAGIQCGCGWSVEAVAAPGESLLDAKLRADREWDKHLEDAETPFCRPWMSHGSAEGGK
jgi:hypothetical protein